MRLEGRVAIVTGGASNLGAAVCRLFAEEGASVVLADLLEQEAGEVVADIEAGGGSAKFVRTDVTVGTGWDQLVAKTLASFGKLNILVNAAGVHGAIAADLADEDGWDRIMAVNVKSQFLSTARVVPPMRAAGGGSIVNFSSIGAVLGRGRAHSAYPASKAGVLGLTRSLAVRYGPDQIRVNAILPGLFPRMRTVPEDNMALSTEDAVSALPLRRVGLPREAASAALFLASDDASFVTGAELIVDGGMVCV